VPDGIVPLDRAWGGSEEDWGEGGGTGRGGEGATGDEVNALRREVCYWPYLSATPPMPSPSLPPRARGELLGARACEWGA
jgi:hypothetical protein